MRGKIVRLAPWQLVAARSPWEHFAMFGGVATGKSHTGSEFSIDHMIHYPDLTGFIGANTYDQLTQASLRTLFQRLEERRIPFVYNRMPPKDWHADKQLPSYNNILTARIGRKVAHAFCRVTSDADALRGIQFSWYWLDEVRDTPEMTHDVVLSRMRESRYRKGLVTTTTNGDDWANKRFGKARRGQLLYGSMHVKTVESVNAGIITEQYYQTMLASYSELMIAQELNAEHVNVLGGRAYYAASAINQRYRAPWGFQYPNPAYPLIVGCDFNFDPAPHVWIVGQISPDGEKLHWFKEISGHRISTPEMAMKLVMMFPGFHYRVYGDRSGMRATTSNAGKPDYDQIAEVFNIHGCSYSIDSDQSNNPLVRNRVENVNRLLKDGTGHTTMTYDPNGCPYLDGDLKVVAWKQTVNKGQGKLDSRGDVQRTHSSDAVGYAAWKLFPPRKNAKIISGIASQNTELMQSSRP